MRRKGLFANIDWLTVMFYITMVFIGWISIYTATYDEEHAAIIDMKSNHGKQLMFMGVSLLVGFVLLVIDSKFYTTFSYPIYGLLMMLLVGVLIFGSTIKGSKSWIRFGEFGLQPAEFAKFATALALAKYLSAQNISLKPLSAKLICGAIIGIPALLILAQGDTGSMLVFAAFILVLFREGLPSFFLIIIFVTAVLSVLALIIDKLFIIIGLTVLLLLVLYFLRKAKNALPVLAIILMVCSAYVFSVDYVFNNVLKSHQRERIEIILGKKTDLKGAGYNLNQSLIAIGSGGLWGKGFLKGTQTKFNFVPEQSTDFIFCTIGEEWGFVGTAGVLLIFFGMLYRIIFLAERQRSRFTRVYAYGVASILFFHVAVNVGMTIGLVPVIGIPFPFVSYGGSSILAFTILLFILLRLDSDRLAVLR